MKKNQCEVSEVKGVLQDNTDQAPDVWVSFSCIAHCCVNQQSCHSSRVSLDFITMNLVTSMLHFYTLVHSSFYLKDPTWSLSSWSTFPARLTQVSLFLSNSLCRAPPPPHSSHSFLVTPMNLTHSSVITFNTLHYSLHLAFYMFGAHKSQITLLGPHLI